MAKVYVKTVNAEVSLSAGTEEKATSEIIATEDMKIIGAMAIHTRHGGLSTTITVQRSGQYRIAGAYASFSEPPTSDDQPLFAFNAVAAEDNVYSEAPRQCDMLPSGAYFELEKDERIYVHHWLKNGHASQTYNAAFTLFVYYTK